MNLSNSTSFENVINPQYRIQRSGSHVRSENFSLTEGLSFPPDFQRDRRHSEVSDRTTTSRGGDLDLIIQIAKQIHRKELSAVSAPPIVKSVKGALFKFWLHEGSASETRNIEELNLVGGLLDQWISSITLDVAADSSEEQADPTTQIDDAIHHEEIFSVLDLVGYRGIAARLRYLHEMTQDRDPEDPAMDSQSLREMALFFVRDDISLPDPEIGICPDGFLQVEWSSNKASALMKFLPDGSVRFAGISPPLGSNEKPQTIQSSGSKELALQSAIPFIINSPEEDETRSD